MYNTFHNLKNKWLSQVIARAPSSNDELWFYEAVSEIIWTEWNPIVQFTAVYEMALGEIGLI